MNQDYRDFYRGRRGKGIQVNGDVFNVGGSEPIAHRDLATLLIERSGRGSLRFIEWPEDAITLRDGLTRTLAYDRAYCDKYLDEPDSPRPS